MLVLSERWCLLSRLLKFRFDFPFSFFFLFIFPDGLRGRLGAKHQPTKQHSLRQSLRHCCTGYMTWSLLQSSKSPVTRKLHIPQWAESQSDIPKNFQNKPENWRMYLWWSLCTLYLHACQVRVTVHDSGLCCCTCGTCFKHYLTPLGVDSRTNSQDLWQKVNVSNSTVCEICMNIRRSPAMMDIFISCQLVVVSKCAWFSLAIQTTN